jgi:hypothetical protein
MAVTRGFVGAMKSDNSNDQPARGWNGTIIRSELAFPQVDQQSICDLWVTEFVLTC